MFTYLSYQAGTLSTVNTGVLMQTKPKPYFKEVKFAEVEKQRFSQGTKLCVIVSMFLNSSAIIKIQILEVIDTLGGPREQIFTHFTNELLCCVTSHLMLFTFVTASGLFILKFSQLKVYLKRSWA